MLTQHEKNTSFLTHLSAFLGYFFPFGSIVGPLIMWTANKDKSPFMEENGRQAVNFNLSYTLYLFVLGMFMFPFAFGSFFSFVRHMDDFDHFNRFPFDFEFHNLFGFFSIASIITAIMVIKFILIIVAAIKASRGETYNYPFTIKFIK